MWGGGVRVVMIDHIVEEGTVKREGVSIENNEK